MVTPPDIPDEPYILTGVTAQRLRTFCSSVVFEADDLDDYARFLQNASLDQVRADFDGATDPQKLRGQLASKAYGPSKLPIFNYILQLTVLNPPARSRYVAIARYLALEVKVPVDGADLSGTTTLMWAISTKPYFDVEFANIMFKAGADINFRYRYGCTAAHDPAMLFDHSPAAKFKACSSLRYFIEHGGDLEIGDGNGIAASAVIQSTLPFAPEYASILKLAAEVEASKKASGHKGCHTCGKETGEFMKCGRCEIAVYCSGSCQKQDWKKHKLSCKAAK